MKTFEKGMRVLVRRCVNPKTGQMKVWRRAVAGSIIRQLAVPHSYSYWLVKLDIGPAVEVYADDVIPMSPLHQLAAEADE